MLYYWINSTAEYFNLFRHLKMEIAITTFNLTCSSGPIIVGAFHRNLFSYRWWQSVASVYTACCWICGPCLFSCSLLRSNFLLLLLFTFLFPSLFFLVLLSLLLTHLLSPPSSSLPTPFCHLPSSPLNLRLSSDLSLFFFFPLLDTAA